MTGGMQGLRKEPELEGHLLLAQKYSQGWLPIQILAIARPITQWINKRITKAFLSPEAFLRLITEQMAQETMPSGGCSFL